MFDRDNVENYSKKELIDFGIKLRTVKKQIEEDIQLINVCLMEMHEIEGKERHGEFNVFIRETTSYSIKKGYDYSGLLKTNPGLFQPNKSKMYKEFPNVIGRKISYTIEMSKDKDKSKFKK